LEGFGVKDGRFRAKVLVFVVLGALMGGQFKTQWQLRHSSLPPFARIEVISEFYRQKVEENRKLSEEIQKLQQEKDQLQKDMAAGQSHLELLEKELEQMKILAGMTSVVGKGVIVKMEDSPKRGPLEDVNALIIHDKDLVDVCNELKAAGAEAIAINGQRLVAMSEIRCSGPVIQVNGMPIGSAEGYTIQAIGDSDALEAGLRLPGGIVDTLRLMGIVVKIRKENQIVIPALTVRKEFRYALPLPPGSSPSALPSPTPSLPEEPGSRGTKAPGETEGSRYDQAAEGSAPFSASGESRPEGVLSTRKGE
jgi:uncharacterized protein YlxW (UPF0749 family)